MVQTQLVLTSFDNAPIIARFYHHVSSLDHLIQEFCHRSPLIFLNIQASSKIIWFEMFRANHHTLRWLPLCTFHFHKINPSLFMFLHFRAIIAIKWYGMKCNTFLYICCTAKSPCNTPGWHLSKLTLGHEPR